MDISKICNYKKEDTEALPCRELLYIDFETDEDTNAEIKRMNRDIKIDVLEGKKDISDILSYPVSDIPTISPKIKSVSVRATKFTDNTSAYDNILRRIISIPKTSSSIVSFDGTEKSLKDVHFAVIKETILMLKDNRRGVNIDNCLIFLHTSNSNIKLNSLGVKTPKDIIYDDRVPVDELIINSVNGTDHIGLNVIEVNDNTFYITDIKADSTIRKIKLKRLP